MVENHIYDDISYLKEYIDKLESRTINMKFALIQMSMDIGWTDEQIKNVIGAFDDELEFFRGDMKELE